MELNARGDTGWTALKYVAHRLGPSEAAAFETLLATDQVAREAVAQAVELSHSIAVMHAGSAAAPPPPAPLAEPTRKALYRQPAAWFIVALAASLLFIVRPFGGHEVRSHNAAPDMLSMTWADLPFTHSSAPALAEMPILENSEAASEDTVPDWLLLGITGQDATN